MKEELEDVRVVNSYPERSETRKWKQTLKLSFHEQLWI